MRDDWVECCFADLLNYEQPTKYIVSSTEYSDEYETPVLTAGKTFIKGYTNEINGVFDNLPTIIFDDFTTASQFVNFKFKVKSSAMKILVPTSELVNMYFAYYAMQSNRIRSDTHKRYWISVYAKKTLLLPSQVEQRAIVKKIETLFSELDKGIADLKTAQAQLKVYRQAVLRKAFEGELVAEQPACNIIRLGNVIEKPRYGSSKKCSLEPKGKAVLRIPNIGSGIVDPSELKYAFFEEDEAEKLALKQGDILTIRSNGSVDLVGKCALISEKDINYLYAGYLIRLRPNPEKIDSKYLLYCLFSHQLRVQIESKAKSTSGVNNINSGELEGLEIPIFELEMQIRIVQQIESRLSVCNSIGKSLTESLKKAEALRQSILKKAFEGTLLSEAEIATCKAEKDYEPASVLLKRIKADKQEQAVTKPATKSKKAKRVKAKPLSPVKVSAPIKISTDIQAGVIAKVIQLHESMPEHLENLTHVKCEKIAHLAESHLRIPLGRVPVKDAAGPDDYSRLKKVEHRARMVGYFTVLPKKIGHSYSSGRNINQVVKKLEKTITQEQNQQLDQLTELLLSFDLEQTEIVATLYAGWNNLLIDGKTPSDEEIVQESRENWSPRKLTIERDRFFKALTWMRKPEVGLIPSGYGNRVESPLSKTASKK